jgi:hypothetical protein
LVELASCSPQVNLSDHSVHAISRIHQVWFDSELCVQPTFFLYKKPLLDPQLESSRQPRSQPRAPGTQGRGRLLSPRARSQGPTPERAACHQGHGPEAILARPGPSPGPTTAQDPGELIRQPAPRSGEESIPRPPTASALAAGFMVRKF